MADEAIKSGEPWIDPDQAPELTSGFFEKAEIRHGDVIIRVGLDYNKKDSDLSPFLSDLLSEEGILVNITKAVQSGNGTSKERAGEILDFYFGTGKDLAHLAIQRDPIAARMYDCAIQALTMYDLALTRSQRGIHHE